MTIVEMHNYVKVELDKTSSLELPAFEIEEIDYWLNEAIRKFVETRYSGTNVKGTSFEESQKRIDDLMSLVETATLTVTSGTQYPNSFQCNLPTSPAYLHALSHQAIISWVSGDETLTKNVPVTQITHDRLYIYLLNPFATHFRHLERAMPLLLYKSTTVDGDIVLITDGTYDIDSLIINYLRRPATVLYDQVAPIAHVNCDLPLHTHAEIVKLAVQMMLENIESNRYSSYRNEIAEIE